VRSRQSGVGVIACTRAPGLIEQLARSDAAVVLNPDREGIARAAADLGSSQVIVLPCDAACTEAAHDAARFLAARSAVSTVRPPVGKRNAGAARETARAGMQAAAPSERYQPSTRSLPVQLPPVEYPGDDFVRKVQQGGWVSFQGKALRTSKALAGQPVALRPVVGEDGVFALYFCHQFVEEFDLRNA